MLMSLDVGCRVQQLIAAVRHRGLSLMLVVRNARAGRQARAGGARPAARSGVATT
jgi:hypothetical protein